MSIAFVTVILDAVFRFHYVYVLIIITIMAYAFVRTLIRSEHTGTSSDEKREPVPGGLIRAIAVADGDLDKPDRDALMDRIQNELEPDNSRRKREGRTLTVEELVNRISEKVTKELELASGKTLKVIIPHPAFATQLTALVEALDIRTVVRATRLKPGKPGHIRMTIEINRVHQLGDSPMDAPFRLIRRHLEGTGGLTWISHPPRKTRIHLILPGA